MLRWNTDTGGSDETRFEGKEQEHSPVRLRPQRRSRRASARRAPAAQDRPNGFVVVRHTELRRRSGARTPPLPTTSAASPSVTRRQRGRAATHSATSPDALTCVGAFRFIEIKEAASFYLAAVNFGPVPALRPTPPDLGQASINFCRGLGLSAHPCRLARSTGERFCGRHPQPECRESGFVSLVCQSRIPD